MLPILYNTPNTDQDWNTWSLSHSASHKKIIQAVLAQKGVTLSQYQLDPIPFNDFGTFLNNNQQAHNDMTNALGITGSDLQSVDITDESQKRAWINLHAQEHREVELALGV